MAGDDTGNDLSIGETTTAQDGTERVGKVDFDTAASSEMRRGRRKGKREERRTGMREEADRLDSAASPYRTVFTRQVRFVRVEQRDANYTLD